MERQDYLTLTSHYIPNEKKYHFVFPLHILYKYNGADNLDVTLDDNLTYFIIEPILSRQIEYNFELIWNEGNDNQIEDSLDVCVKVNDESFDPKIVIENLERHKMISRLVLFKEEYNKLNKIY
jgi:hypothetical protein